MKKRRLRDMKLLVILLLVGHGVSGGPTFSSKARKTTTFIKTENEKNHNDELARQRSNRRIHLFSDEIGEEKPKRERETDRDYLNQFIKDFLIYHKFKHLFLRDNNVLRNRLNLESQKDYNENESADIADARSLLPRPRKRWWKAHRGRYVPERFKKRPERADDISTSHSDLHNTMKFIQILSNSFKNNEVELSNTGKTLAKYLQYYKKDEKNKNLENLKRKRVNKEADMAQDNLVLEDVANEDLVNRIMSEIKLLLGTHKGHSQLYVGNILDIIRNYEEFLISHPNQACRNSKLNYLIHGINKVYQRYLTNAECEGKYLDTGLDVIEWILLNRNDIKVDKEIDEGGIENFSEDKSNNDVKDKSLNSNSDYSSSEDRLSNSLENERKKKTKYVKRSLTSVKLAPEELKINRDPNKSLLDWNIKSRLLRGPRSMIFHNSNPYYREIEKLFTKQENANTGLDFIRLVCEKIASEQFLHSVEAIIRRLFHNADCKAENALKGVKEYKDIKPVFVDLTKHRIDAYSSDESSYHDIPDFTTLIDEGSLKYSTDFNNGDQNDENAYSEYEAVPWKFKHFIFPVSDINLRNKYERLRHYTRLRNDHLSNIFDGLGKINSLKVIKQKLKNMNVKDYKKLMDNLPVVEKLLKIIYKKLPPQLQAVLDVLKPGVSKMVEDGSFSLKKIPSLLTEAFSEGKGKDLLKMMADKFKKEKFKSIGKVFKDFHDETLLRNKLDQDKLLATTEPAQLDTLPHVEVPSGIEKNNEPVVELTYLFNHPPVIHYKPKFFVKHNITYDQYLQNIKNIYNNDLRSADNQIQLVKVVKKEGNESQVFYETDVPISVDKNNNKSAILKLYDQFYDSTDSNHKKSSIVDRNNQSNNNNERPIEVLKLTPPTAKDEIYHTATDNTVSPVINLKEFTELNPEHIKSENTSKSVSKSYENALEHNDSRSDELIFDNAKSVELDITAKPEPQLSRDIGRKSKIQWNEYPINRPKYNNNRKRSINQLKEKKLRQ